MALFTLHLGRTQQQQQHHHTRAERRITQAHYGFLVGHGRVYDIQLEYKHLLAAYAASETKRSLGQATPQTVEAELPAAD